MWFVCDLGGLHALRFLPELASCDTVTPDIRSDDNADLTAGFCLTSLGVVQNFTTDEASLRSIVQSFKLV